MSPKSSVRQTQLFSLLRIKRRERITKAFEPSGSNPYTVATLSELFFTKERFSRNNVADVVMTLVLRSCVLPIL
uniref:Uncharacterized protein n=1 Tax=Arundo donax TaxID=35708 RepID=A0A0A8XR36_ARUDO